MRGEDEEYKKVQPGDAVFWHKGEGHETKAKTRFTALVIESEHLNPSVFMPLKSSVK